jgi:multisubunit Na+/H+ antiporter MnhC subunit
VLAPNYKQHNLSPAEVRKACYSLACLISNLFEFIRVKGGVTFVTLFKKGDTGYESFGTSDIGYITLMSKQMHSSECVWIIKKRQNNFDMLPTPIIITTIVINTSTYSHYSNCENLVSLFFIFTCLSSTYFLSLHSNTFFTLLFLAVFVSDTNGIWTHLCPVYPLIYCTAHRVSQV